MKNFLFLLMLFFSLHAKTQVIESKPDILRPIELTESDTIMGRSVSKEIGSSGGKMISDDGRIELIFPQGALVANTKISIQPIPNVTVDGSGKSYQLEPSGIQFKKPVELIFHYTDEEAETCPPLLMGLTTQDHNGEWSY
ncbi:MAG: hypothetical protein ACXWCZ_11395, partial [Flavisolibacter sp.]